MIYLSIGSNVGDRADQLQQAVIELSKCSKIFATSSIYETPPWGNADQEAFYNAAVAIDYDNSPLELLKEVKSIEQRIGRKQREHWGPREIDIDIIFWHDNAVYEYDNLHVPHRHALERAFVLVPILEIVQDSSLSEMLADVVGRLDSSGIVDTNLQLDVV